MNIDFIQAKDGSQTFSVNKVFFHSSYSPSKEAERFIEGLNFPYNPKLLFFIEPGLSYCTTPLKKKFNQCKFVCIRLFDESVSFPDENNWDFVIRFSGNENIKQQLINKFSEELLLSSAIALWKPAQNIFPDLINCFFENYKSTLEECKTLLVTRQFFEKKWLTNCCNFISYTKRIICTENIKTDIPVVVCASGPSLEPSLPFIKAHKDKIFIICLSSATKVLITNNIIPDIVLTTDGGYWAGEHLKYLKNNKDIPVAAPCEAFIPKKILQNNPVLVLKYNDSSSFISNSILEHSDFPCFDALRNPTVSGTALYLANNITSGNVYFCGLDLSPQKGFQHTQPNELEKNNQLNDSRIKTNLSRTSGSRFNSQSLKIYEDWFSSVSEDFVNKTFRVINPEFKQNSLGNIKDISSKDFELQIKNIYSSKKDIQFKTEDKSLLIEEKNLILNFIKESFNTEKWQKQLFPADFISINNSISNEEIQKAKERLQEKINKIIIKIGRLTNE